MDQRSVSNNSNQVRRGAVQLASRNTVLLSRGHASLVPPAPQPQASVPTPQVQPAPVAPVQSKPLQSPPFSGARKKPSRPPQNFNSFEFNAPKKKVLFNTDQPVAPVRVKPRSEPVSTPKKIAQPPKSTTPKLRQPRKPAPAPIAKKSRRSKVLSVAVCLFLLGASGWAGYLEFNSRNQASNNTVAQVQGASTQQKTIPDETPLAKNSIADHVVDPDAPRRVTIAKARVNARVLTVGVGSENQLKAPESIFDVGWHGSSVKPGVVGDAMVMNGIANGPTKPGVFAELTSLVADDIIEVERGDGQVFRYKVVKTEVFNGESQNPTSPVKSITPGKPGLNLIAFSGTYNQQSQNYSEYFVVFATLR